MAILPLKKYWLLGSLVLIAVLAACGQAGGDKGSPVATANLAAASNPAAITGKPVQVDGGEYYDVTPAELNSMLAAKDFVFVNVHIPFEGDIANTDLSIPYDEIGQHLDELPADKSAKIVLYCRSGRMSAIAAEELIKAGYTNVWNLAGGFNLWENQGLPIEGR